MQWLNNIPWPDVRGVIEIALMAVAVYYVLLLLRGTRGAQVFTGLLLVIVGLLGFTYVLQLDILTWLIQRFSVYIAVGVLVIFQPEIRRLLAELGRQQIWSDALRRDTLDALVNATVALANEKVGALIALERQVSIQPYEQSGMPLGAVISSELLRSIFYPDSPMHDGGVIIRAGKITAASCLFPLSQKEGLDRQLGTRHRAAIGLSEETDALVIAVSEETGTISIAYRGRLRRGLDERHLRRICESTVFRGRESHHYMSRWARWTRFLRLRSDPAAGSSEDTRHDRQS